MIRLKQKKKKKYKQLLCSVVLLALTLFVFGFAADRIRLSNESEQTAILEKAVTRTITQCYALEGSYPPDIAYLTTHVRNDSFIRNAVEYHRSNRMQSEEPSACLVDAFGDEIGRINLAVVEDFLVLERIMNLSIRHRAGIVTFSILPKKMKKTLHNIKICKKKS